MEKKTLQLILRDLHHDRLDGNLEPCHNNKHHTDESQQAATTRVLGLVVGDFEFVPGIHHPNAQQ